MGAGGAATRFAAARGFAGAALLAATRGFTTTMTAQQAEEGIRASGRAEHHGDAQRRKGTDTFHREGS